MNIRNLTLYISMITLLFSAQVIAADFMIGYVNTAKLLEASPYAEKESKKLQAEFSAREEQLIAAQKELKSLEQKMSRDGAIMSESERQKLGMDILSRQREMRRMQQTFNEDLTIRRNEILGRLQNQIQQAIEIIGEKEGFDLILYEGIAYASGKLDLTDKVLKLLIEQKK